MPNHSTIEIKTILSTPISLDFVDYINCYVCDYEIDLKNLLVDDKSYVECENCNHMHKFKIVNI